MVIHNAQVRQYYTVFETFFKYLFFKECGCNGHGTTDGSCDANGICACKDNVNGYKCDQCAPAHYGLEGTPACQGM